MSCSDYDIALINGSLMTFNFTLLCLRVYQVHRGYCQNGKVLRVQLLSILASLFWITNDVLDKTFCFVTCSRRDSLLFQLLGATFVTSNCLNYLLMIEKYRAVTKSFQAQSHITSLFRKPGNLILNVMKVLLAFNTVLAVVYASISNLFGRGKEACFFGAKGTSVSMLLYVYSSIDLVMTFTGIYLFYLPFRSSLKLQKKIAPLSGPTSEFKIRTETHSVGMTSIFSVEIEFKEVVKWNLIGVLLGQLMNFIFIFSLATFRAQGNGGGFHRFYLKPVLNFSNILGISLMFRDHTKIKIGGAIRRRGYKHKPIHPERSDGNCRRANVVNKSIEAKSLSETKCNGRRPNN